MSEDTQSTINPTGDETEFKKISVAAEAGNADAQYMLGLDYEYGRGIQKDAKKACQWFEKASDGGNADAQFLLGLKYEEGKDIGKNVEKAYSLYQKSARGGNPDAQYILGQMYLNGERFKVNIPASSEWLKKSAEGGNVFAQNIFKFHYRTVRDIQQAYEMPEEFFRKAAEWGDFWPQMIYGKKYRIGKDSEQKPQMKYEWFDRSGNDDQQKKKLQLDSWVFGTDPTIPIDTELAEDVDILTDQSDTQDSFSELLLGIKYENGIGVEKDLEKAWYFYEDSIINGADNAYFLYRFYYRGECVEKNLWKALYWLKRAAEKGYPFAQADLGLKYEKGEGVDQDSQKAEILFQQAVKTKDERIPFFLYLVFDQGAGLPKDKKKAAQWLKIAEEKGEPCALWKLCSDYEKENDETAADYPERRHWMEEAAKSGDYRAKTLLERIKDEEKKKAEKK